MNLGTHRNYLYKPYKVRNYCTALPTVQQLQQQQGKNRWTVTNLINDKPSLTADDCDSYVHTMCSTLCSEDTYVSKDAYRYTQIRIRNEDARTQTAAN